MPPRRQRKRPVQDMEELFGADVPEAKARVVELMRGGSERVSLEAALAIIDRVLGKPRQMPEPPAEDDRPGPITYYEVVRPGGPRVPVEGPGSDGARCRRPEE